MERYTLGATRARSVRASRPSYRSVDLPWPSFVSLPAASSGGPLRVRNAKGLTSRSRECKAQSGIPAPGKQRMVWCIRATRSCFVTAIESTISLPGAGEICCKAESWRVFSNNRDVYGTKLTLITPKRSRNWKRRKRRFSTLWFFFYLLSKTRAPTVSHRRRREKGRETARGRRKAENGREREKSNRVANKARNGPLLSSKREKYRNVHLYYYMLY